MNTSSFSKIDLVTSIYFTASLVNHNNAKQKPAGN